MTAAPSETEQFLYRKIPITRAMGVRVVSRDEQALTLEAPLSLNHNHLGTAFGGSLGAMAMLAGYVLLWLELRDRDCHVVISESAISFRRPVRGDIRAICRKPDAATMAKFHRDFARKGKARLNLNVTIEDQGTVVVEFSGTFVALTSPSETKKTRQP